MLDIEPAAEPLNDKDWHKHLGSFLDFGELNPEILPFLDYKQTYCINEIKKHAARKQYKERLMGDDPDEK